LRGEHRRQGADDEADQNAAESDDGDLDEIDQNDDLRRRRSSF
jgi:hypothetical protein